MDQIKKAIEQVEQNIDRVNAQQLDNAMIKFADALKIINWRKFRTSEIVNNVLVDDPCTKEQMLNFLAHAKTLVK